MMSMVGVEHTKFINPNLTWKTVSKGSRSSSRRPRKLNSRSPTMGVDQAGNSSRKEDASASETEKLGESVLGQRFGDRIEHVPIKKRKFLFRPPSPPARSPSPHRECSELLINSGSASGHPPSLTLNSEQVKSADASAAIKFSGRVDDFTNGSNSEVKIGKLGCSEDFSGIEMLVAAACNEVMNDDEDKAIGDLEKSNLMEPSIDASLSTIPSKKASSTGDSVEINDPSGSGDPLHSRSGSREDQLEDKGILLQVDRSHWDLNTVMDAWEQPSANPSDSQTSVMSTLSENVLVNGNHEKALGCDTPKESGECVPPTSSFVAEEVLSNRNDDMHFLPESRSLTLDTGLFNGDEIRFIPKQQYNIAAEFIKQAEFLPNLTEDKCLSSGLDAHGIVNSRAQSDKVLNLSLSSPKHEHLSASRTLVEECPIVDTATIPNGKPLVVDKTGTESSETCEQKEHTDNGSLNCIDNSGESVGFVPHEQSKDCIDDLRHCSRKLIGSDGCQADRDDVVAMENMSDVQEGYDSQFEDGELRESLVQCLKDIEGEEGEAEQVDYESDDKDMYDADDVDRVSCERNVREASSFGDSLVTSTSDGELNKKQLANPSQLSLTESSVKKDGFEKEVEVQRGLSLAAIGVRVKSEHSSVIDTFKDPSHIESSSSKWSPWEQKPDGCVRSDATKEMNNESVRRNLSNCCPDNSDVNDISNRGVGLRDSRRGILSCGEGPSSFNMLRKNRSGHLQQQRSYEHDDLCAEDDRGPFGSDRALSRMRSSLHTQGRGRGGAQLDEHRLGLWNAKNHNYRNYDGPYDSRKLRTKSVVTNSDSKVDDCSLSMYSPPKDAYRPFVRRRSPVRREDGYNLQRELPARELSSDSTRGRSGRHPQRLSPKEGYFRSLPNDSDESFVRMPNDFARRDRSFSPNRAARAHQRYRSRSRSQSPLMRQLPRDRNAGLRPPSRSPDFRSDARVDRGRLPVRKPGFDSDYEVDFVSPPRRRFSPKRNTRWVDDRNRSATDFRNRRSPGRIYQNNNRFNSPGSPGRLKPDDYFRPAMRGGRYSNNGGRGNKGGDDDYRRKPVNRFQMFHPVRRYGTDGSVRRFQYDADDFVEHDSDNKDACSGTMDKRNRDMPRDRDRNFNMWP